MARKFTTRRRMLQALFGGSLLAVLAPAVWAAVRYLAPLPARAVAVAAGNIAALSAPGATLRVRVGIVDALLMRTGDTVTAFNLKCTHAGCTVAWVPEQRRFQCPCHGGIYDAGGAVVHGPPPAPLRRLRVQVDANGEITVFSA